jgi:NADP-dependent 3-hydroxy acid dehydrogenase YdfG
MTTKVQTTKAALDEHTRRFSGQILNVGTFAGEEFDRLYHAWIAARWDAGDSWVRSVWQERPTG